MSDRENKLRKKWFYGISYVAVISTLSIILNTIVPIGKTNIAYAVESIKTLTSSIADQSSVGEFADNPQVKVPVDLEREKNNQKSVDAGHSPWKLDPVFVTQVFVSLKISPEGIQGDYPIKYENLKIVKNTEKEAIVEVLGDTAPIRRVYLQRLVRQDSTGIWTVVGYDPVFNK
ncbi:hypothetical protein JOC70_002807 [Clostridium pascui]|uniref:hypothetical protein n=1 Tax=Clostridium pascui TaxID=46609 RepID=UPI001FAE90E5|nr:hypothetical protein [Clostridium pascui]MBM7871309.1 hypothetical protein [Clostridium pascui]